jgi:hypothetical protein
MAKKESARGRPVKTTNQPKALSEPERPHAVQMAIDVFLRSLAKDTRLKGS